MSTFTLQEDILHWKKGNRNIRIEVKNSKKRNLRKRMWWLKGWMMVGIRGGKDDLGGEGKEK